MQHRFIRAEILFVTISTLIASACQNKKAQAIHPGEWEVATIVTDAKGVDQPPVLENHCISAEAARHPTLRSMITAEGNQQNHSIVDDAIVNNGRITANGTTDAPDGDIRGIPESIDGFFDENSFQYKYTIQIYGTQILQTIKGHRVGNCT